MPRSRDRSWSATDLQTASQMGPMIRARGLKAAEELIADALKRGAKLAAGGKRPAHLNKGHFLEPTVLTGVSGRRARHASRNRSRPIAPIVGFSDVDEVIARANALPFGLAGYVFTQ